MQRQLDPFGSPSNRIDAPPIVLGLREGRELLLEAEELRLRVGGDSAVQVHACVREGTEPLRLAHSADAQRASQPRFNGAEAQHPLFNANAPFAHNTSCDRADHRTATRPSVGGSQGLTRVILSAVYPFRYINATDERYYTRSVSISPLRGPIAPVRV